MIFFFFRDFFNDFSEGIRDLNLRFAAPRQKGVDIVVLWLDCWGERLFRSFGLCRTSHE